MKMSFAAALIDGIARAMREDPTVSFLLPEKLLSHTEQGKAEAVLHAEFKDRIFDAPYSESAMTAFAAGAGLAGRRILVNFGTAAFVLEAFNQLINEAAVAHYMSGGQVTVPATFIAFHGVKSPGAAAQHSVCPQAMLSSYPGLEVVLPSTPADVKGLMRSAIRSNNPTFVLIGGPLIDIEGEVPEEDYVLPLGKADIKLEGKDVTVVATSLAVHHALEAAAVLAKEGIGAEVIDPRSAVPLDLETIYRSVRKTGRLVTVDETPQMCSIGSEIAACVASNAFRALKAPIGRVAQAPAPMPYADVLEEAVLPGASKIVSEVRRILKA
jgi:pyruvate dehydrogenase E1 component beta subunit